MSGPLRVIGLICGALLAGAAARAADDPVDPDFLEFLGTVDSNEAGWHDYLAATDVDALIKAQGAAPKGADRDPPAPANGKEEAKQP